MPRRVARAFPRRFLRQQGVDQEQLGTFLGEDFSIAQLLRLESARGGRKRRSSFLIAQTSLQFGLHD